jgi:hypothetical protein
MDRFRWPAYGKPFAICTGWSEHVRTEPVHETFRGETVWEGDVQVFHVFGHATETEAYAWDHGGRA